MRRWLLVLLLILATPLVASANQAWHDWCWNGNQQVVTSGLNSSTLVQASSPLCTVSVFVHGGGLATIFSDNAGTPLANPFTAQTNGQILWYAANGRYDETLTLTINGQTESVTYSDILLCDPFAGGSSCGGGGMTVAHNLLSTTHLDTVPASPPTRGDVITAQSLTSPSGVNPAWARLALGSTLQVLKSNGTDAIWAYSLTLLSNGTPVSTRSQLNFLPGTNTSYLLADDPSVNSMDVTVNAFEQYAHNGTIVSARPIANFNDTATAVWTLTDNAANNRVDITATASGGGGTGCTVGSLTDTMVLSIHPSATCYGSANFTWDDNNTKGYNLTAGHTNNTCTAASLTTCTYMFDYGNLNNLEGTGGLASDVAQFVFAFGQSLKTVNASEAWVMGVSNNLVGDANVTNNFNEIFVLGENASITATDASTQAVEFWDLGDNNTMAASLAGTMNVIYHIGKANTSQSGDAGSITSSNFIVGEANSVSSNSGGQASDIYLTGETNRVFATASASSTALGLAVLGFNNTVNSTSGQSLGFTYAFGDHNTISATSATVTHAMTIGFTGSLTDCSHCYLIGENGSSTGVSNFIGIGLSATPELQFTPLNVRRAPVAFASLPTCAAGTEGSFAAITNSTTATNAATITGGGTHHVLGYCNGTNWLVATGT